MNVYDSARMQDALAVHGFKETDDPKKADVLLLNTCHIREKASEKLFSELGRLARLKKKGALVVVAGCVVQADGAEILRRSKLIDIAIGPQNYHQLPELIAQYIIWSSNGKDGKLRLK